MLLAKEELAQEAPPLALRRGKPMALQKELHLGFHLVRLKVQSFELVPWSLAQAGVMHAEESQEI